MQKFRDRETVRASLQKVFDLAVKERSKRNAQEKLGDETQPGWVFFEREAMCTEVNRQRSARGLKPVSLLEVLRAERMAVGHSDYASKFCLYCADLAVGER